MNKKTWRIGGIVECRDCDYYYEGHKNAQAVGANHAKHHNHFVVVETHLVSYYNYPDDYFKKFWEERDRKNGGQEDG